MSLLLNEDFTLYQLRLGYLNNIQDGVGERLINLNTAVLNEPAFRAAGWAPDTAAIKRCYSPPIPTTGEAEYFTRPVRSAGLALVYTLEDEQEAGGLISGRVGSEDTIGAAALTERERRRRKQKEKMDEDDSSDLSDDSEEEDTAAQSVRFAKMPVRQRSNTSPIRDCALKVERPEVKVISPSYRPRTSSLGATESLHAMQQQLEQRPRRDTTTSSEFSSEGEQLDPNSGIRKKLPNRPQRIAMLTEKIAEEASEDSDLEDEDDDNDAELAEASDLSEEFEGDDVAASPQLLGVDTATSSSPLRLPQNIPQAITPANSSPKKAAKQENLPKLPKLPPGRPMSTMPVASLLSLGLRGPGGGVKLDKPFQRYAELSGKGESSPLWIKIYAPFSKTPDDALEVPMRRSKTDGQPCSVSELTGLALWRYQEEGYEPELKAAYSNPERWELRMVEDGEVDLDFPALGRSRPVTDFTSNNNRPPQRRARDKPWDEFGLVRAESGDAADDETTSVPSALPTPQVAQTPIQPRPAPIRTESGSSMAPPAPRTNIPNRNPITTAPSFTLANVRTDSTNLLDAPQQAAQTSTPRTGAATTVSIHFTDPQSFQTTVLPVPTTADTYIAEIFDVACARLRLDKALYVLKVRGTQTVAPSDRTVEALGSKIHLDLIRRRFGAVGDFGLGLTGSPGSSSPNAPLELVPNTPPTAKEAKRRKGFGNVLHPLAAQQKGDFYTTTTASMLNITGPGQGRRYKVLRKQPMSFTGSHPRTLVITPEFMQILPSALAGGDGGAATGKVTNIRMSSIVGVKASRKHPKLVRVLVYREKETKRYDFECSSAEEANAIVGDIRVGLAEYGAGED